MHEFYMNLSFKIFDRSENLFKIIYGVIIFWPLDMTLKIDVHSFWTSYDHVKMSGLLLKKKVMHSSMIDHQIAQKSYEQILIIQIAWYLCIE